MTETSSSIPTKFTCDACGIETSNKRDYNKHLLTPKHKMIASGNEKILKYICQCGKEYKNRHNLSRHKKNCNFDSIIEESVKIETNIINVNMIIDIIKENQEIKKLLLEQNDKVSEQNQEFKKLLVQQNKQIQEQNKEHNELINLFIERK